MRLCEDLEQSMAWMGKNKELQVYVTDKNGALDKDKCRQYAETMLALFGSGMTVEAGRYNVIFQEMQDSKGRPKARE